MAMLLTVSICQAQLDTATILGTVLDSSGAVIPGAKVVVENMGTSATVELTTDPSGIFIAPVLPVGKYKVTVSMTGFNTYVREGIQLNVADRVQLSAMLKPGALTQEVTVVGQAALVDTASSTLGGVVGSQQVSELPLNGRALTQLLSTVPGVLLLGPPSMNGASMGRLFETATRFLMDGTDSGQVDSDLPDGGYLTAARMTRASVESVEEVRIQESSYDAEYGQASGGVVNFITKSGTNNFHGSLFEYFRNEVLDARDFFSYVPPLKPAFRLNQYGGSLGGPLKRDKLFFFVDYEGDRQRLGVTQTGYVPTEAYRAALNPVLLPIINTLPLPNLPVSAFDPTLAGYTQSVSNRLREDTFAVKTDYTISSKDRLSARYNFNDSYTYTYFGFAQGQARPIPYRSQLGKLTYTRTLTPTLLNEAGFGVNRVHAVTGSGDGEAIKSLPITLVLGGVAPMGPALFDLRVGNTSYTYLDTLSWVKGRNQFKFGTQIVRPEENKAVNFQNYLVFLGLANAPLDFASNIPYELLTVGNPMEGQRNKLTSYFAQDDMQARKNLTLNLGLRYDYNTAMTESYGRNRNFNFATGQLDPLGTSLFDPPKLNFAPRVGFAWTPTASRSLVVRGGYGIFFITINPVMAQDTPANDPVFGESRLVTIFDDPFLTGFPTPPNIQSFPSSGALWVLPHDFHSAYNQDWNLNIQQGLGEGMVLQVAYIGNRGTHYLFFINANQIDPVTKVRSYAGFSDINDETPCCSTSYNALQVSLKRRMTHGLALNLNYTWSHNLDIGGLNFGTTAEDSLYLGREWGDADYDVRHVLEFDYTYQLPGAPKFPNWLGKGWQINGLTVMRSGTPVDVVCSCDPLSIGLLTSRADVVPGVSQRPSNYSLPFNQINYAAFSSPVGTGALGNVGRNTLKGPAVYNWDFSLFKNFRVKEHQTLEFRAEIFNIFNTPQFAAPSADISSPATFGQSLSTIGSAGGFGSNRQIQFALRYAF
jgi:hypothetical protein